MIVGQGPIALAVGVGRLDIFSLVYPFSPLSPSPAVLEVGSGEVGRIFFSHVSFLSFSPPHLETK